MTKQTKRPATRGEQTGQEVFWGYDKGYSSDFKMSNAGTST
jgi:hypothetical protein